MNIREKEYFFVEWLIIEKKLDNDSYMKLTAQEIRALELEWLRWLER